MAKDAKAAAAKAGKAPPEASSSSSKDDGKGKAGKAKSGEASKGASGISALLSKFRPRQRLLLYCLWLGLCAGILFFHDTCDIGKKKNAKQDCGVPGITAFQCRTYACFFKGGGEMITKILMIDREEGQKFGAVAASLDKETPFVFLHEIKDGGAFQEHNSKLPAGSEDRILPRDSIYAIDGVTGAKNLRNALRSTGKGRIKVEIRRSKLPSYLRWIHRTPRAGPVETVLTSPGLALWGDSFMRMGGLGLATWFFSGYPIQSIVFHYLGLSGVVAFHLNRCCHDDKVSPGVPHCYKGSVPTFDVAAGRVQKRALDHYAKFREDPRSYLNSLLVPEWPRMS